jgi:uncharacterized protein YbjT (DUF2867 family)
VLFYHSSIVPPGIAGLAEIASEPFPDPTAFDPKSKYFDPRAARDASRSIPSPVCIRAALVLGATGAVGGALLDALLASSVWSKVTTFGRRPARPEGHAKLSEHLIDVARPENYETFLAGHDTAFCTLGVGEPSRMSKEEFRRIDYQYVLDFAQACRRQGVKHFLLLGAVGANAHSRVFYLRVKGELEEAIASLGFESVRFFRPSMILTPVNRYGLSQAIVLKVWPRLGFLLAGRLRKYRGIRVEELGRAMAREAERARIGVQALHWDEFKQLLRGT